MNVLQFGVVGYDGPCMQIWNVCPFTGVTPFQSIILVTSRHPSFLTLVTVAVAVPPSTGTEIGEAGTVTVHMFPAPVSVTV